MKAEDVITVIAIGSHKVAVTVGVASTDQVVAHKAVPCRWHELGEGERRATVAEALRQAEESAGLSLTSVFLSRSSPAIGSRLSTGHASLGAEMPLREEEKGWALRRAREQATGIAHEVVMTIPVRWKVRDRDGERDVDDPLGQRATHLSCEALLITAEPGYTAGLEALGSSLERHVEGVIPTPVGLYRGIAGRLRRQGSSLVLDLGARHTTLLVHRRDRLAMLETHRFGGDDLTQSIADALRIGWDEAEALKRQLDLDAGADAALPGQQSLFAELAQQTSRLREAARVCRDDIEAFFRRLADELRANGHLPQQGTIHLVGRGAGLGGLPRVLHDLFNLPVRIGSGAADRDAGAELDGLLTSGLIRTAAELRRQAIAAEGPTLARTAHGLWAWLSHRYS